MKPILFNTDMVRAILDGRKTVTRRCVKPRSKNACGFYVTFRKSDNTFMGIYDYDENERQFDNSQIPPAQVGDFLYVRETWCALPINEAGHMRGHDIYYYRADGDLRPTGWKGRWRPSIHMPKEAARIFLRVTDVRVERLQDITPEQARQEGCDGRCDCPSSGADGSLSCVQRDFSIERFESVWDNTIRPADRDGYSWDANPWVWVIEFERISQEEVIREENK